jgi:WD40 repeat protein
VYAGVTQLDNVVHTGKEPAEWNEVAVFSPNGKWLAIGSHDNGIYIFDTSTWKLKSKGDKHHSFITALDWSMDSTAIHSTSGDYELLFWTVSEAGQIT